MQQENTDELDMNLNRNNMLDSDEEFLISCLDSGGMNEQCQDGTSMEWLTKVSINNCHISLKVDTGAQINVISQRDLLLLNPRPRMLKRHITLRSYQGQRIPCMGLCTLTIRSGNGNISALFAIVPEKFQSILGLSTAMKMGILDIPRNDRFTQHEVLVGNEGKGRFNESVGKDRKEILTLGKEVEGTGKRSTEKVSMFENPAREANLKPEMQLKPPINERSEVMRSECKETKKVQVKNSKKVTEKTGEILSNPYEIETKSKYFGSSIKTEILDKYSEIFEGVGRFGKPYRIRLKEGYTPVVSPVRRVPYAKKQAMKAELDRMESIGVISKIDIPTEFVNSLVLTPKDSGEIRCCLDPRGLNKFIERERYHIKTRDEIFAQLAGATVFSQLDLKSAFWQIPLDEESKNFTAFGTPWGRYVYNVLAFGLSSASEICQKNVEEVLIQSLVVL